METINQLALELYENKYSYKENDYITIMNILRDYYNKIKGKEIVVSDSKNNKINNNENEEDDDEEMVNVEYSDSYLGDNGYLSDY